MPTGYQDLPAEAARGIDRQARAGGPQTVGLVPRMAAAHPPDGTDPGRGPDQRIAAADGLPHRRGVIEIHSDRLRAQATHEIGACHAAGSGPYGMTRRHERLEGARPTTPQPAAAARRRADRQDLSCHRQQ